MAQEKQGNRTTRDDVIRALLDTAFVRSAGATSMGDVAASLGIKKASLYNHVQGREQLVADALESCRDYVRQIEFVPRNVDEICAKYPAQSVLRAIAERYLKMHERRPLFQIYTFVESLKYFDARAADIVREEQARLERQAADVLDALVARQKIAAAPQDVAPLSRQFCLSVRSLLSDWLLGRKQLVMQNPAGGEGELFPALQEDGSIKEAELFASDFLRALGGATAQ